MALVQHTGCNQKATYDISNAMFYLTGQKLYFLTVGSASVALTSMMGVPKEIVSCTV